MLTTNVKASRVDNLTDARYFAAWEVKWIGFNLVEGTESYCAPAKVKAMKEWLDGPQFVGEFSGLESAEELYQAVEVIGLDAVQLGHFASADLIANLEMAVLKEVAVTADLDIEAHLTSYKNVEAFVLNFNNEITLDTTILKNLCAKYPIVINANMEASQLKSFLETVKPLGLAVAGGEEEAVGVKSFDDLDEFFEQIEILV